MIAPTADLAPAGLLPEHWAELQASGIAADVAALNVASFGPGTDRHWEDERAQLVAHKRREIQTESIAGNGHPQTQPGFLADRLIALDRHYRHLQAGGWRTLSDTLPGLPVFDQWKPTDPRQKGKRDPGTGEWRPQLDRHGNPVPIKYEAPPAFPDGGGLLLPRVPARCWRLICERQGLPFPDDATRAAGFWAWAAATPALQLLICEGWKKALAAISAGWAALALPGVQNGGRLLEDGSGRRLIAGLRALSARHKPDRCTIPTTPGRPWLIAFDAEGKPTTAAKVGAAAGALAHDLRAAGGRPLIARLPLLPGTEKTGLDDLLAAGGPEALDRALANTGPVAVLPVAATSDRIAPAGAYIGNVCPIPSPQAAPLVVLQAPMGSGKTQAIAQALAPLAAVGVPVLMPSHRSALGQAAAESIGVPWRPEPGSDERLQGVACCWDSWAPDCAMQITGHGWSGGAMVLDEWAQACEHLLLSTGTALGDHPGRRVAAMRTAAEQLPRMLQTLASDAQMPAWAVRLLERLSGRRAYVIASAHRPMAGRRLIAPEGFKDAGAAADGFRARWAQMVAAGDPFLCWVSAQKAERRNSAQRLAAEHRRRRPADLIDVIDSTTRDLAAELAADPDWFARRRMVEAQRLGVNWALYCTPAISSGISFSWDPSKPEGERGWRPAAVLAYAGGRIAPEHVAQALARVRCPEVPAYLYAPERCPGGALKVGSGATTPAQLIADLRATADPLLGMLQGADAEGAWLQAWGELGAVRNRQRFAYAATIRGLLEREGWALQEAGPEPCPAAGAQAAADLAAAAEEARAAQDAAVIEALPLTDLEAQELARKRSRTPEEDAALSRHRIAARWALGAAAPSLELLEADRDGLSDRLRLGWMLTTPEALDLIPARDRAVIDALDPEGRPFEPDRLRVALTPRVAWLQALGTEDRPAVLLELLQRFANGETIAAHDPAIEALHLAVCGRWRAHVAAAVGVSPGTYATGTLRALLRAVGWQLERAGRVHARGADRGALTYRARRVALPQGVDADALSAVWLAELQSSALTPTGGALSAHRRKPSMGEKCASPPPTIRPFPLRRWPLARNLAIPWTAALRSRSDPARSAPLMTA